MREPTRYNLFTAGPAPAPGVGAAPREVRMRRTRTSIPALLLVLAGCQPMAGGPSGREEISREALERMGLETGSGSGSSTTISVTALESIHHATMQGPLRMALAADGSVWVTDPTGGAIHHISDGGDYDRKITTIRRPYGIAIDAAGQLVVGDGAAGRVVFLDPTSGQITGTVGAGVGEFGIPQDIAIDSVTGDIWVVDSDENTVVRAASSGAVTSSFGSRGTAVGSLHFPAGIALDEAAGEVYVADSNNARVQVFDTAGTYKRRMGSIGSTSGKFVRTQGVALDGAGVVFVADVYQGRVGAFTTAGTFSGWIGSYGTDAGSLSLPSDLLYDSFGRLWIASTGTGYVEVVGLDGYTEPAPALPATAAVDPASFSINGRGANMDLYLDVASSSAAIDVTTVVVDGDIPMEPMRVFGSDVVYDGITYETQLRFERPDLQDRYEAGTHTITVEGLLDDGSEFSGTFTFTMTDNGLSSSTSDTASASDIPSGADTGESGGTP